MMKQLSNEQFFAWVEAEIAEKNPVRFRLKGQSMFPLLRNERDIVVLYPCREEELRPMDVVLFRYRGMHVLHRILRIEGEQLFMQGDGSYVASEVCTTADVVGVVRAIIRPSGKQLSVESWRWRIPSRLWRSLGVLRVPMLRVLHRIIR